MKSARGGAVRADRTMPSRISRDNRRSGSQSGFALSWLLNSVILALLI
jgi:hypothetical protein